MTSKKNPFFLPTDRVSLTGCSRETLTARVKTVLLGEKTVELTEGTPPAPSMSYASTMSAGDVWVQWFKCCVTQQAPQKRRRIDRSMIGQPTNFMHLGHVGAGDMQTEPTYIRALQIQMQSKGSYETAIPVTVGPSHKT